MLFSERSTSVWKASEPPLLSSQPLQSDIEADVCIVGAGIAGLSVAYELTQFGREVVVLDDNAIGGGETAQTTAHLASALDDRYYVLEQVHGLHGARLAYVSHDAAIMRIEQIARMESIDCDFQRVDGYLFLAKGDDAELLERELGAVRRAGCAGAELLPRAPSSVFDTGPCIRFPNQAQFHPLRYLAGLTAAITRERGRIFTSTHVVRIEGGRAPRVATALGATVNARAVVVATNSPVNDRVAIHTKQAPYRTFVIALEIPPDAIVPALYWDTGHPYHYVRVAAASADRALLIVGGEDHKTGHRDDARERFVRLETWTRKRFRMAGAVTHRWSGQVLEPADGLAFIGRSPGDPDKVLIATGDSGNGMTHGVVAGMLIRDLLLGRPNEWEQLYDPARKPVRALKRYAQINLAAAGGYADWLKPSEVPSADRILPGSGAVLQRRGRKLAVYRDQSGALSVCSAVCTHLGGVVRWNSAEQSWDCPCHGSRFSPHGKVLNGPALHELKRLDVGDVEPVRERVRRVRASARALRRAAR